MSGIKMHRYGIETRKREKRERVRKKERETQFFFENSEGSSCLWKWRFNVEVLLGALRPNLNLRPIRLIFKHLATVVIPSLLPLARSPCFFAPFVSISLPASTCVSRIVGVTLLLSVRRQLEISDGSNVIITCHLGLDIPGDEECLMWVGVNMERRPWQNNK